MANVNHTTLTDPYLHEPKGVASAAAGTYYRADGGGSGAWKKTHYYVNGYLTFNDVSTYAYQHSVTTSFTPLNPTFSADIISGFTAASSPNARLVYSGTDDITAALNFTMSLKNDSGTQRDLYIAFYKNGSLIDGGQNIISAESGTWAISTLTAYTDLSTDDYIEVHVKGDASFTLDLAGASFTIMGVF